MIKWLNVLMIKWLMPQLNIFQTNAIKTVLFAVISFWFIRIEKFYLLKIDPMGIKYIDY